VYYFIYKKKEDMKNLRECLNEAQINESKRIYVLVLGENHEGIYDLIAAYTDERKAKVAMEEYEKTHKIASSDYVEVIEVDLH
jgi:hypothetical protein